MSIVLESPFGSKAFKKLLMFIGIAVYVEKDPRVSKID